LLRSGEELEQRWLKDDGIQWNGLDTVFDKVGGWLNRGVRVRCEVMLSIGQHKHNPSASNERSKRAATVAQGCPPMDGLKSK
jgi:hypothetical protein